MEYAKAALPQIAGPVIQIILMSVILANQNIT